jgi:hypothetical protein
VDDSRSEVESLESLLESCHHMLRKLEHSTVRDDGRLGDALREACRRIEARLERLVEAR